METKLLVSGILLFSLSVPAMADSVYVKERLSVSIRADKTPDAAVVGRAQTGTSLDVLEQGDTYTRVRTPDGVEGYIANSSLTHDKPAAMRLLASETKLKAAKSDNDRLAAQVKSLQDQLKKAEETPAPPPPVAPAPASQVKPAAMISLPNVLWLAISFAMLITGFIIGVIWIRERTRRKLGGMHIRVN